MTPQLLTPQEAQRRTGLLCRAQFWNVINKHVPGGDSKELVHPVRYTARCVRFYEPEIEALKQFYTVASRADRARLADGRRRS